VGRAIYRKKLDAAVKKMMLDFYNDQATIIQKRWRGFFVRKYVHNYYARKHYLAMVEKKNSMIRERLDEYNQQTKQEMAKHLQDMRQKRVEEEAKKTHFLMSTAQIPGVYNSPYRIYPHEMEFFMKNAKYPVKPKSEASELKKSNSMSNSTGDELPPIKKVQGPFRNMREVSNQRNKPLNPTLRVQTSYLHLEEAREQMKLDEWRTRLVDDVFQPFTQYRYPYQRLMHGTTEYGDLPDNYLRTEEPEKHVSSEDFKRVVSPVPVLERLNDTYSKGAGAIC
jgi:hypothetical protein